MTKKNIIIGVVVVVGLIMIATLPQHLPSQESIEAHKSDSLTTLSAQQTLPKGSADNVGKEPQSQSSTSSTQHQALSKEENVDSTTADSLTGSLSQKSTPSTQEATAKLRKEQKVAPTSPKKSSSTNKSTSKTTAKTSSKRSTQTSSSATTATSSTSDAPSDKPLTVAQKYAQLSQKKAQEKRAQEEEEWDENATFEEYREHIDTTKAKGVVFPMSYTHNLTKLDDGTYKVAISRRAFDGFERKVRERKGVVFSKKRMIGTDSVMVHARW